MASNPTFVASLVVLKQELRLGGVWNTADDAQNIIERAVLRVRLGLVHRLGESLVTELLAITYSPNPSTDEQRRRALANLLEIEMVKQILFRELPHLFMDSSGQARHDWNTNAAMRDNGPNPCDEDFIEFAVNQLTGDDAILNQLTFSTATRGRGLRKPRLRGDLIQHEDGSWPEWLNYTRDG